MALLFNRSATNRAFRKRFFSSYKIEEIVNFSALRHFLFSEAVGPGVAVIFSSGHPTGTESILYLSPKPSFTIQDDLSFVIEPQDRAEIPLKEASDSQIVWKVAMWGSPRDYELARKLSQHRTLDYVSKSRGWIYGEGYIEGTKKSPTKDLFGKLEVTPHSLTKFVVKTESLKRCQKKAFYRWAKTKLGIYRGPHLLIAQSPRAEGDFVAAVMREDSVFSCRIAGVHGSTSSLNDLISVCQVVNSDLYAYFEMLTSGRWLVERDDLEVKETMNLPIPDKLLGRDLDYKFLERLASDEEFRKAEQNKLMSFYGISDIEREIIQDTIRFTLDYFRNKGESNAIKPPSEPSVEEYLKALCDILNQQFASSSMNFGRIRYLTDAPLRVVSLRLSADRADRLTEVRPREEMNTLLRELDNSLIEEKAAGIYIRRHLRRYSSDSVHIIKPNQARYWTRSSAFVDADKIYAEIMRSWSAARVEMP
jgi:hypothetical protein